MCHFLCATFITTNSLSRLFPAPTPTKSLPPLCFAGPLYRTEHSAPVADFVLYLFNAILGSELGQRCIPRSILSQSWNVGLKESLSSEPALPQDALCSLPFSLPFLFSCLFCTCFIPSTRSQAPLRGETLEDFALYPQAWFLTRGRSSINVCLIEL